MDLHQIDNTAPPVCHERKLWVLMEHVYTPNNTDPCARDTCHAIFEREAEALSMMDELVAQSPPAMVLDEIAWPAAYWVRDIFLNGTGLVVGKGYQYPLRDGSVRMLWAEEKKVGSRRLDSEGRPLNVHQIRTRDLRKVYVVMQHAQEPSWSIFGTGSFSSCRGVYEDEADAMNRLRELRDLHPPDLSLLPERYHDSYDVKDIFGTDAAGWGVGKGYQYNDEYGFLWSIWVRGCVLLRGREEPEVFVDDEDGHRWLACEDPDGLQSLSSLPLGVSPPRMCVFA